MSNKVVRDRLIQMVSDSANKKGVSVGDLLRAKKGTQDMPAPLVRNVDKKAVWEAVKARKDQLVKGKERLLNLKKFTEGSVVKNPVFHGDFLRGKGSGVELLNDPMAFDQAREMGVHVGDATQANQFTNMGGTAAIRLATSPDTPKARAEAFSLADKEGGGGGFIEKYYINVKNPIRLKDHGGFDPRVTADRILEKMADEDGFTDDYFKLTEIRDRMNAEYNRAVDEGIDTDLVDGRQSKEIQEWLKSRGYDSIVYSNEYEGMGRDAYILFDRKQIKSATGNTGEFNKDSDDILRGAAGVGVGGGAASQVATEDEGA